nr:spore germination protein [Tissierella praeacuta]
MVLGSAAVEAKFVSAPIVIVVGMSGITSLITPTLGGATVIIKLALIVLSSILGLYGYVMGMSFLLLHLLELKSFGVPYMTNLTTFTTQDLKDTVIRAPRQYMKYRPKYLANKDPIRTSGGKRK